MSTDAAATSSSAGRTGRGGDCAARRGASLSDRCASSWARCRSTPNGQAPVGAGVTFFAGSIFFTTAAFIQLSLSGRRPPRGDTNRADRADWWAAVIQFFGTLCFNVSTLVALLAAIADPSRVGAGWRPDAWGSVAFLVSSVLAVVATKDRGSPLGRRRAHVARHLAEPARLDRVRRLGRGRLRRPRDRRRFSACSGRTSARCSVRSASSSPPCSRGGDRRGVTVRNAWGGTRRCRGRLGPPRSRRGRRRSHGARTPAGPRQLLP